MKKQILNEFYNSPAPDVYEETKGQIFPIIIDSIKKNFPLDWDTFNPELKAITIDQIFYIFKEQMKKDMGLSNDYDKSKEEREREDAEENQMNSEINESLDKIKSEFKRFL